MIEVALIILILPLIAFLSNILLPKSRTFPGSYLSILLMLGATVGSVWLLFVTGDVVLTFRINWFTIGNSSFSAGILLDFSGIMMLAVVSLVSLLVHIYSTLYMAEDEGYKRYFAFLGMFTFAMNGVILSGNLLLVFFFWELVGLSSYLLIGHWYLKDSASKAAKKAFIINRIGDTGFIIALCIIWVQFGTFDLTMLTNHMANSTIVNGVWAAGTHTLPMVWLTVLGIGLFAAAIGKSAQFPLQIWLPDAMEGPTPVSALIHAATMVAAGVFLMSRVFVLLDVNSMMVIAVIGAVTAFMGAVAALAQNDIKKVLAFSTISQLGYMIMGIGSGAYEAAMFHLFTHAFFKAALFLAAGSVIHSLYQYSIKNNLDFDAQNMQHMGGLRSRLPVTFYTYTIAAMALMGVPLFSGFLSKDALLMAAVNWSASIGFVAYLIPILAFATVALTAFYMTRQLILVFFGDLRMQADPSHLKEGGWAFKLVLLVLGALSLSFFWSSNPLDYTSSWLLGLLPSKVNVTPQFDLEIQNTTNHGLIGLISFSLVVIGVIIGWLNYKPGKVLSVMSSRSLWIGISSNNWYLNEIYEVVVLKPITGLTAIFAYLEAKVIDRTVNLFGWMGVISSFVIQWFDRSVIDGLVNFSAIFAGQVGAMTKSFQYGKVQSFVIFALVSLLLIILFIL